MIRTVDIRGAKVEYLHLISDAEAKDVLGKGWTLPFVYSFQEIRDVYLAFCKYGQSGTVAEFSNKYVKGCIPAYKSPWDDKGRRVLEIRNALINFGIIDKMTLDCKKDIFVDVKPGSPLSSADKQAFKEIFFGYFRLQEYSSLFIKPDMGIADKLALTEKQIQEESSVLFYYGSNGTRIDSFFYTLDHPKCIYTFPINEKGTVKGGFVRFWDMFLSWASQLELVERLNMKRQEILLSNGRSFNACYFVNPECRIDIHEVLQKKFPNQLLVDISYLVMELCLQYRCSISKAHQAVIDFYLGHPKTVSLIRTSEIFIKETELNKNDRILYPKYKGSFVSHIKIRKNG